MKHSLIVFSCKKNVTIRIEKDLTEKAKDLGLNISKVSENALKDAIERLEGPKISNSSANSVDNTKRLWRGVRDLNPRGPKDHRLSRDAEEKGTVTKEDINKLIFDFKAFCVVDLQLTEKTAKTHRAKTRRFLNWLNLNKLELNKVSIRDYLSQFNGKNPYTYANNLKSVKVFCRDFLGKNSLVDSFKFPTIPFKPKKILNTKELQQFYKGFSNQKDKTLFLLYASSGLRRQEALCLRLSDINFKRCMVSPQPHNGRTKHTWLTFFNYECLREMKKYLRTCNNKNKKLFPMARAVEERLWYDTREKTGIRITPQMLREWFCNKLGALGIQDRYIDAFCGRLPRSVLARHYSDYSPEVLERIYNNAKLKILS